MPTYEYECGACGHQFEKYQSIKDGNLRKCPVCSKWKLKRLIGSGGAVIFKGSGFYQTDYRSKSYQDGKKSESVAASSASDTASAKKETKSATETKSPKETKTSSDN